MQHTKLLRVPIIKVVNRRNASRQKQHLHSPINRVIPVIQILSVGMNTVLRNRLLFDRYQHIPQRFVCDSQTPRMAWVSWKITQSLLVQRKQKQRGKRVRLHWRYTFLKCFASASKVRSSLNPLHFHFLLHLK